MGFILIDHAYWIIYALMREVFDEEGINFELRNGKFEIGIGKLEFGIVG
jgi:hypothetical protein